MKHQKGAALIVVLSLLTVSLMVGLSSMQSSQIDERLAGNYKAQAEAVMNAESGMSYFLENYKSCDDMVAAINGGFSGQSGVYELASKTTPPASGLGFFDIFMLGYSENARAMVRASGNCEESLSLLAARSAYSCVEGDCGFRQGASSNGGISGFDHTMDDDTSCKVSPNGTKDRVGAIFSDADFSSQGYDETEINNLNVEGDPNYLANLDGDDDGYVDDAEVDKFLSAEYLEDLFVNYSCEEDYNQCLSTDAEAGICESKYKQCRSVAVNDAVEAIRMENQLILDYFLKKEVQDLPMVHVVNEGEEFEVKGRFDGVVVLNGGKLVIRGGDCIVGGVLGYGTAEVEAKGNPEIVGTVIARGLNYEGNGRPGVRYSSAILSDMDAGFSIVKKEFDIESWMDDSGVIESGQ